MEVPITDSEGLKTFIRKRTSETWKERHAPYYMSYVAIDLKKAGIDYRQFISPLKLSQWATTNEVPDTKLVVHPQHKAKIAFVPASVDFEFSDEPVNPAHQVGPSRPRGRALLRFVDGLVNLPDEAIEDLQIPAKTLVALLKA